MINDEKKRECYMEFSSCLSPGPLPTASTKPQNTCSKVSNVSKVSKVSTCSKVSNCPNVSTCSKVSNYSKVSNCSNKLLKMSTLCSKLSSSVSGVAECCYRIGRWKFENLKMTSPPFGSFPKINLFWYPDPSLWGNTQQNETKL